MSDFIIPDFLKYDPNRKTSEYSLLIDEYEAKFGRTWSTEGYDFTVEEWCDIFRTCLAENRTFYDVLGDDLSILVDEDDEI